MHKDTRELIRRLEADGWTVRQTRRGHLRCCHPAADKPVFVGTTPSDWRALRNARSQLEHALRAG